MKNLLNLFKNKKQANTQVEEPRIEVVDNFEIDDFALIYINDHLGFGNIVGYSIDCSNIAVRCINDNDCNIVWGDPTNIFVKTTELEEFQIISIKYDVTSINYYEDIETDILFDNVCILKAIDGKHKLMIQYEKPKLFIGNGIVARRFSS